MMSMTNITEVSPYLNLPAKPERRRARLLISACRKCGSAGAAVVSRTDYVVYVRCSPCGSVWSLPKPGESVG